MPLVYRYPRVCFIMQNSSLKDINCSADMQTLAWCVCSCCLPLTGDRLLIHCILQAMHAQLFEPALPEEKLQALKGLSIGTVDKIFLDFSSSGAHVHLPDNHNPTRPHTDPQYER